MDKKDKKDTTDEEIKSKDQFKSKDINSNEI